MMILLLLLLLLLLMLLMLLLSLLLLLLLLILLMLLFLLVQVLVDRSQGRTASDVVTLRDCSVFLECSRCWSHGRRPCFNVKVCSMSDRIRRLKYCRHLGHSHRHREVKEDSAVAECDDITRGSTLNYVS